MAAPMSSIRPLQLPRLANSPIKSAEDKTGNSGTECSPLAPYLPQGWSLNERDQVLNEDGLMMVDIREEYESETLTTSLGTQHSKAPDLCRTTPDQAGPSSYQLPKSLSVILDQLELEELESKASQTEHVSDDGEAVEEQDHTTLSDLEVQIEEKLAKDRDNISNVIQRLEKEAEDLKSWGKNGLEGLKDVFQSAPKPKSILKSQPNTKPIGPSTLPRISDSSAEKNPAIDQEANLTASSSKSSKANKKCVSFALEPQKLDETSSDSSNVPLPETTRVPSVGIMLPDIIEHPLAASQSTTRESPPSIIDGKNGHLNPRLASLLPRSYIQSHTNPHSPQKHSDLSHESDRATPHEENSDGGVESDYDSEADASSLWSIDEDDDDGEWPPNDLDIQAALDLRQTVLEYHAKRQSLGIGAGTGPLGGDQPPSDPDQEAEWVPIDTRPNADGVPRQAPSCSRFKAGRLPTWNAPGATGPNQVNMVDGKLFGTAPVLDGPAPSKGAAVYELPGRTHDSTEMDEDLSPEEMELLVSRLNILAMDEESRVAAETAGTVLMGWMEKARKGEIVFDEEQGPEIPLVQASVKQHICGAPDAISDGSPNTFGSAPNVKTRLFDQPPEVKTVLKRKNFFPGHSPCDSKHSTSLPSPHIDQSFLASTAPSPTPALPKKAPSAPINIPSATTDSGGRRNDSSAPSALAITHTDSATLTQTAPIAKKVSRFKAQQLRQGRG